MLFYNFYIFLVNRPCSSISESSPSDQSSPSPTANIVSPSSDSRGRLGGGLLDESSRGGGANAWSVIDVDAGPPGETARSCSLR